MPNNVANFQSIDATLWPALPFNLPSPQDPSPEQILAEDELNGFFSLQSTECGHHETESNSWDSNTYYSQISSSSMDSSLPNSSITTNASDIHRRGTWTISTASRPIPSLIPQRSFSHQLKSTLGSLSRSKRRAAEAAREACIQRRMDDIITNRLLEIHHQDTELEEIFDKAREQELLLLPEELKKDPSGEQEAAQQPRPLIGCDEVFEGVGGESREWGIRKAWQPPDELCLQQASRAAYRHEQLPDTHRPEKAISGQVNLWSRAQPQSRAASRRGQPHACSHWPRAQAATAVMTLQDGHPPSEGLG
ncbi:hypothetical protein DFH27DRAFT_631629 [Peziza echinospora]|nr:hypothetical protein DFH27DRAFT_631629 [Peziza echinospora]